jgi:uncharacterized damage-inducible protein DinB
MEVYTMFEQYFNDLAGINKSKNELMNEVIKNISEEEWNKEFNGFYKSINELCSHIYIADYNWLNWLKGFESLNHFAIVSSDYFQSRYKFKEIIFKNIDEYISLRIEMDNNLIKFVNGLEEKFLNKILKLPDGKENYNECKIDNLVMHIFYHSMHHRGMIALYLDILGKNNDFGG